MSFMVTNTIKTISAKKKNTLMPLSTFSLNGFFLTASIIKNKNHPPSKAGIGRALKIATETESPFLGAVPFLQIN